jgi:hypothetical protein
MQTNNQKTWINSPTKNQVILFCLAWTVGILLLVSAMTDFFTESLRNQQLLILGFLSFFSFVTVTIVLINYARKD